MEKVLNLTEILNLPDEAEELISALADVIINFDINMFELVSEVRSKTVEKMLEKGLSKGDVMLKTGLSKHALNNIDDTSKSNPTRMKLHKMLSHIRQIIDQYCYNNNTDQMPKILFYKQVKPTIDGEISIKSCIEILKKIGIFEESEQYVSVKFVNSIKNVTDSNALLTLSETFSKTVQTVNFNLNNNNQNEDNNFHQNMFSSQIHPSNAKKVKNLIQDELRTCSSNIYKILVTHEDNVDPGTYNSLGTCMVFFNDNN